jgi:hypothetical protein
MELTETSQGSALREELFSSACHAVLQAGYLDGRALYQRRYRTYAGDLRQNMYDCFPFRKQEHETCNFAMQTSNEDIRSSVREP